MKTGLKLQVFAMSPIPAKHMLGSLSLFHTTLLTLGEAGQKLRGDPWLTLSSLGVGTYLGTASLEDDITATAAIVQSVSHGWNIVDTAANYRDGHGEVRVLLLPCACQHSTGDRLLPLLPRHPRSLGCCYVAMHARESKPAVPTGTKAAADACQASGDEDKQRPHAAHASPPPRGRKGPSADFGNLPRCHKHETENPVACRQQWGMRWGCCEATQASPGRCCSCPPRPAF